MNSTILRPFQFVAIALLGISMFGCVSISMPPPSASLETVQKLRTANLTSSTVGKFNLAPHLDAERDKSVSGLRGSSVSSSYGSYSLQLKEVIIAELKAAGLYDEKSPIQIEAQLTDSQVDAAIGTGTARLAAKFKVNKAGKQIFEKELSVESQWPSSFVGAIAIPEAINQYSSLYKKLAAKLFDDQDFRAALAR